MRWTDAEKDAVEDLFQLWGMEWKRHADEYVALGNRSKEAIAGYIKNNIRTAEIPLYVPPKRSSWPAHGVILFHDDPRAIADHGSFGTVSRAVNYSTVGCSARWASEAA